MINSISDLDWILTNGNRNGAPPVDHTYYLDEIFLFILNILN